MQKLRRPMGSLSDPVRAVFVLYVSLVQHCVNTSEVRLNNLVLMRESGKADSLLCEYKCEFSVETKENGKIICGKK